jgi:hypothetical protein
MQNPRLLASQDEGLPEWLETRIKQLVDELSRYCGPIFIVPSLDSDEIIDAGTYALIDTGEKRLLVTCHHVWEKYEEQHDKNGNTVLAVAVGDSIISFKDPLKHRISFDRDLDIVVLEFEPETIGIPHKKSWFKVTEWPISKVDKGTWVVTLGYPGALRSKSEFVCRVQSVPMPLNVTDTSDRAFSAFCSNENRQVLNDTKNSLGYFGGISGSPAYCYSANGELRIVGFVKGGQDTAPDRKYQAESGSLFSGAVLIAHASFLERDGKLNLLAA